MKYFFKFIIEILIAIILFVVLVKFTPVFESFSSEPNTNSTENTNTSDNTKETQSANTPQEKTVYYNQQGKEITKEEYFAQFTNDADIFLTKIASYQSTRQRTNNIRSKRPCTTPRGTRIPHGSNIIAYSNPLSFSDNICQSEIRICQNGRLNGSFQFSSCEYEVNGLQGNSEVIDGATNSFQDLIPTYIPPAQTYIQPTIAQDRGKNYTNDGKLSPPSFNKPPAITWNNKRKKIPYKNADDWYVDYPKTDNEFLSCVAPRGESIAHGQFVYAYEKAEVSSVIDQCIREKRPCINGTLYGTFIHDTCKSTNTLASLYAS